MMNVVISIAPIDVKRPRTKANAIRIGCRENAKRHAVFVQRKPLLKQTLLPTQQVPHY